MVTIAQSVRPHGGGVMSRSSALGMGLGGRLGIAGLLVALLWSVIALGVS